MPYTTLLDEQTGLFKDNNILRTGLEARLPGVEHLQVISSCGSGYAGTVLLLALAKLGMKAPLYDGSVSEWKANNMPMKQSQ